VKISNASTAGQSVSMLDRARPRGHSLGITAAMILATPLCAESSRAEGRRGAPSNTSATVSHRFRSDGDDNNGSACPAANSSEISHDFAADNDSLGPMPPPKRTYQIKVRYQMRGRGRPMRTDWSEHDE
jgi:hypothetical protein